VQETVYDHVLLKATHVVGATVKGPGAERA
jgi:hypothetical protein